MKIPSKIASTLFSLLIATTSFSAQYGRPSSTVSTGDWSPNGAATLHEATDDITANNDTDYALIANSNSNNTFEVALSSLIDPGVDTGHIIRITLKTSSNKTKGGAYLYQGGTLIATLAAFSSNGSYSEGTYTLTSVEAASISNYADLRIRVDAPGSFKNGDAVYVTKIELELPDPAATPPTLSSPTFSIAAQTSATLGATVDTNGGDPLVERGTVWNTTGTPTVSDNKATEGGTGLGTYTHSVTGLPSGTLVYFRGYATNSIYSGYSPESSFYTEPGTQASNINFTSVEAKRITINWSQGSGDSGLNDSIVVVRQTGPVNFNPTDYTTYTANASFGSGTPLNGDNYVIYAGSGTSVTLTNLNSDTAYYVAVFAYSGTGSTTNYLLGAATATQSTTPPTQPNVSTPTASDVFTTTAVLGATVEDDGADTISDRGIVWNTTGSPTLADNSKSTTGTLGAFTTSVTGLPAETRVYFRGYATNSVGTGYSSDGIFWTEPGTQASNVTFTNADDSSVDVNWVPGTGDGTIVVVKAGSTVDVDPVDYIEYSGNSTFGSGIDLGSGNYIAFKGTGSSFRLSNLTAGITYYVAAYAYIGTGTGYSGVNYRHTSGSATGSKLIVGQPQLSTPSVAAYPGQTSATLGATVDNEGGGSLNEKGIVWNTTGNPTTSDTKVLKTPASGTGAYTVSVSGLPASSIIYFKGFASNADYTGYSPQGTFYTEPSSPAVSTSFSNTQYHSFEVSYTRGNGDGVLVLARKDSAVNTSPTDWIEYSSNSVFGVGDVINGDNYVVYKGPAASFQLGGLINNSTYYVAVFEYKGSGNGTGGINYIGTSATGSNTTSVADGHNAQHSVNCDQCHSLHSAVVPRGTDQKAVCVSCHNPSGQASNTPDVGIHTADCGSCHDIHNNQDVFNATDPHTGGVNADNVTRVRTNAGKYFDTAIEPLIFQQTHKDNKVFTYDTPASDGKYHGLCQACHTTRKYHNNDGSGDAHPTSSTAGWTGPGMTCDQCHPHSTGFTPDASSAACIDCHGPTGSATSLMYHEFTSTSSHVGSTSPADSDCKVCHMEPDELHMDGNVDLRDPDTGLALASVALHTTRNTSSNVLEADIINIQNNLCFKCHDADGALYVGTIGGDPIRPFSSGNDVVNIYDAMDPANSQHHAVRAAGNNPYCTPSSTNEYVTTMNAPWNQTNDSHDIISCFDCHELNGHGSSNQRILLDPIDFDTMESVTAKGDLPSGLGLQVETLCTRCHAVSTYVDIPRRTPFGSIFEYHGSQMGQHSGGGGNELGCMGCHGAVVNLNGISDDNTGYDANRVRGSVHGDTYTFPGDSNTPNVASEHFMYGGWINSWERGADGTCNGGTCNHGGSFKYYTLTSVDY